MNTPQKIVTILKESSYSHLCHQVGILLPEEPLQLEFDFI